MPGTSQYETLLTVLERELEIFDRGDRPDYEVIRAIIVSLDDTWTGTAAGKPRRLARFP
jgi:hypothetical protein